MQNLHGHTHRVEVFVKGETLDKNGILKGADFSLLNGNLADIVANYDNRHSNHAIPRIQSAENIPSTTYSSFQ